MSDSSTSKVRRIPKPLTRDSFYASRKIGHATGVKISTRISPAEDRALDILLYAYKPFGYQTKSDIFRHAVRYLLVALQDYAPYEKQAVISEVILQLEANLDQSMEEDAQFKWAEFVKIRSEQVQRYLDYGDEGEVEAKRVVRRFRKQIEAIRSPFWRGRGLKEFEEKFGYLEDEDVG